MIRKNPDIEMTLSLGRATNPRINYNDYESREKQYGEAISERDLTDELIIVTPEQLNYQIDKEIGRGIIKTNTVTRTIELSENISREIIDFIRYIIKQNQKLTI
jgi:hypothetical protein